jgi:hypothetical protein
MTDEKCSALVSVLCISVAYCGAMKIVAIIGLPGVIHSITNYDWVTSFNLYVNEVSRIQRIQANWIRRGFIAPFSESAIMLIAVVGLITQAPLG